MENKYYTPSEDEFVTRLPFKMLLQNGEWYEGNSVLTTLRINTENFRVKYLDKEDIESLGFEIQPWGFKKGDIVIEVENINNLQKGTFDIYCVDDIRFKGKIKNKSELIKLIRQLEII